MLDTRPPQKPVSSACSGAKKFNHHHYYSVRRLDRTSPPYPLRPVCNERAAFANHNSFYSWPLSKPDAAAGSFSALHLFTQDQHSFTVGEREGVGVGVARLTVATKGGTCNHTESIRNDGYAKRQTAAKM